MILERVKDFHSDSALDDTMDRDIKRTQEEQQRMQKELFEAINSALGGKKFFCNIVVHQGETPTKIGTVHNNSFSQLTNLNFSSDSFDLVKNMLLNYKGMVDQSVASILGLLPPPQTTAPTKEYQ